MQNCKIFMLIKFLTLGGNTNFFYGRDLKDRTQVALIYYGKIQSFKLELHFSNFSSRWRGLIESKNQGKISKICQTTN